MGYCVDNFHSGATEAFYCLYSERPSDASLHALSVSLHQHRDMQYFLDAGRVHGLRYIAETEPCGVIGNEVEEAQLVSTRSGFHLWPLHS
jgi:hypothetical protein